MPVSPAPIELVLTDLDPALVHAWSEEFAAWPSAVTVSVGRLEQVTSIDALITAGNSYGQMDGGVDCALANHFPGLQRAVWAAIADESHGYLPVGSALVVPIADAAMPWLVYAPTMRVPMSLRDHDVAVHDAFWAALVAIGRHNTDPLSHPHSIGRLPRFRHRFRTGHPWPRRSAHGDGLPLLARGADGIHLGP